MGFFAGEGIAIDLGSSNTTVYLENEGIVLREPTAVLTMADDLSVVLAVGGDAYELLGKEGEQTRLFAPIIDGAVTDCDLAALLMLALCEKATGRRRPTDKCQLLVSMSQGLTKVERDALLRAAGLTGAKRVVLVKTPLAAALGAGINFDTPRGVMVVVLGGGVTEIAVLSMGTVVAARSMRSSGFSMDEAIRRAMRREKGLVIGLPTAEDLKCDLGAARRKSDPGAKNAMKALPGPVGDAFEEPLEPDEEPIVLKGRDQKTGKPKAVSLTADDVADALREPVGVLVDAISDALTRIPPALAADILDSGICLSGGGALLPDLAAVLAEETGVPVSISEHPHEDVILGIGRLANDERLLRMALDGGSAEE